MKTNHRNAHQSMITGEQQLFIEICQPLFKVFGINYFRYIRHQHDGKLLVLSSDSDRDEDFFKQHQQSIRFVESYSDYQEYYDFSALDSSQSLAAVSQMMPWVFRRFILYFREQARDLLSRGKWKLQETHYAFHRALGLLNLSQEFTSSQKMAYLQQTDCKRYYLNGAYENIYLTPKELEVMVWAARGKSTHEIAVIVGCSLRTIEKHITTVKYKLSANRLTHVIRILVEQKILEASVDFVG